MKMIDEVYYNGELQDSGAQSEEVTNEAIDLFVQAKLWFEEHGLPLTQANMENYKEKIVQNLPPDIKELFDDVPGEVMTPEQLTKELATVKKVGFWALVVILIILIVK